MSVTDQLREAMESSGLSRYALAKATGIDMSTVHRFYWDVGNLSADGINKMAEALGLELKPKRATPKPTKRPTRKRTPRKKGRN